MYIRLDIKNWKHQNRLLRVVKMRELIFWILYGISAIAIVYRINKALLYFNGRLKKKNT